MLPISGIQHFAFCRRQWALIYLEDQWAENLLTAQGDILHEHAHDAGICGKRRDIITMRALRVSSSKLGVSGECDVVEFRRDRAGVPLNGYEGLWQPYPVEYKHGVSKLSDADRMQLCCQAMCLEEMLACSIPEGALFYGETRRREAVGFSDELKSKVISTVREMHEYASRGYTPKVKTGSFCRSCSLRDVCLPKLCRNPSAKAYINAELKTEEL
jgi:CRISPR-associated exonuclease Cas4